MGKINYIPLFPHKAKYLSIGFLVISFFFGYIYFFTGENEILQFRTLAIISIYFDSRYFEIIETNIADEISAIFFIVAFGLFSFSKSKQEKEYYNQIRLKAFIFSVYYSMILWIFCFIFVYGWAIFIVSAIIPIIFLIIYNSIFAYLKVKYKPIE
jgi:hypothetical protein